MKKLLLEVSESVGPFLIFGAHKFKNPMFIGDDRHANVNYWRFNFALISYSFQSNFQTRQDI